MSCTIVRLRLSVGFKHTLRLRECVYENVQKQFDLFFNFLWGLYAYKRYKILDVAEHIENTNHLQLAQLPFDKNNK